MNTFRIVSKISEESEILCGRGAAETLSSLPKEDTFLFTDENVARLYGAFIARYFSGVPAYAMAAGEENKTPETLLALLECMAGAGIRRTGSIVCLGGGVVGDIGGLASALYMRGIDCIQVPTTLLAQVDSSVGGKTAVDFCGVKNLIGAFCQPKRVLVDPLFFGTLPPRELRCGLGEIVKHAALNGKLFDKLKANRERLFDLDFLAGLVPENIAIKADVVKKDAHEAGLRRCLNLGHTTGHAFELLDGRLSHGEYVLLGILFEAELAKGHAACDTAYLEELKGLALAVLGGVPELPSAREAAELARLDKKNGAGGQIAVAAPVKKGEYAILNLPFEEYAAALGRIREELC